MTPHRDQPKAPPEIERVLRALVTTAKAVSLYPKTSTIPRDTATACAACLAQALAERSELRFVIAKEGLFCDDILVSAERAVFETLALSFYNHHLADVRFHAGVDARSIVGLLSLLQSPPEEVAAAGGFESRLWDLNIPNISVTEVHVSIVDADVAGEGENAPAESLPASLGEIDEIVAGAYGGRARDQLTVARFLRNPSAVSKYLRDTFSGAGAGLTDLSLVGERFAELAEIAYTANGGEGRLDRLRALGASLAELDPDLRHGLLVEEVFPEARTNEALAAVIRELDLDEICRMLVSDVGADEISRQGLARAIRNLSMISLTDFDQVITAAGAAMRGAGFEQGFVGDVLEMTLPSRVMIRQSPQAAPAGQRPVDAIYKLMDLAPLPEDGVVAAEPEMAGLKEEARRGITDGDVIMSLVSLVAMDVRGAQFATTMSMLEDSLGLLVSSGEIDIAADAADELMAASQDVRLDEGQRMRLSGAIKRFTRPSDVQAIAHALRVYSPGSSEHEAAQRLLGALGPLAVDPLLEQLASEDEMQVRKLYVDLLSSMATRYVSELGEHVSDHRWFVVRNVVGILGSTRSSATLPYIERVVRHPEARVRREVIRALSHIHDRRAHDLLVHALSDDDAQNVQLAARYLGTAGIGTAIPALIQVAKGEGRGNRESGPRVEAIEALGRMGATEALPALTSIARSRSLLGGGRGREVRTAAEAAATRITGRKGGER